MRHTVQRFGLILGLFLTLVSVVPTAAQASSAVVGTTTVGFNGEWVLASSSSPTMAYLIHQAPGAESSFTYMEVDSATLPIPDALYVIEMVVMPAWRDAFGVQATPYLAQGGQATETPAPNAWELMSADLPSGPVLILMAVDMNRVPGKAAVELMMATPENFPAAFPSAQAGITVNGQPGQFAGIDANAVYSGAGITAQQTTTQQPAQQTTTQQPAQQTTTQPQTTASQSAVVGSSTIAYGGDWQYIQESSNAQTGFFQHAVNTSSIFAYLTAPSAETNVLNAVQQFSDGFFSSYGATAVQPVNAGLLPSGRGYLLQTMDRAGVKEVLLLVGDVTSAPGEFRVEVLIAPLDQFGPGLVSAQQSFQVNGVGAFSELDANYMVSLVGGAPLAPTGTTGQTTTTTTTTTPPGGDLTANYQIQDAPTGCDGIGWVITDPAQRPATQADIDRRGACVGGATYVADCGEYDMQGTPLLQCTVHVSVTGAPMNVSVNHFTVVDGAGNAYQVDIEALTVLLMLFGGEELPEATVQPGTSVSGMLLFNVPADAPGPWVIQVAPETIATTGEAPGTLVIDGALQTVN